MKYKTVRDMVLLDYAGQGEYVGINTRLLPKHDDWLLTPLDESVWKTEEEIEQHEWLNSDSTTCTDKTIEEILLDEVSEQVHNYYRGLLCVFEHLKEVRVLHLSLKAEWYRMIEAGIKQEEYREINAFWNKRLVNYMYLPRGMEFAPMAFMIPYTHVEFSLGYPKRDDWSRRMQFEVFNISLGKGNPKWGAPDKDVFKIALGQRVK